MKTKYNGPFAKNKTPPVEEGQELVVMPDGIAEEDPYVKYHGFIIFIKNVPVVLRDTVIRIKITAVKGTYAFAHYQSEEVE